ncbi:kinase-like domain-containing protein [Rhizophagus irregularis DAOM 181602=DAOM 197198]|uniref:Kinase-like domain-containing protein n=1 Tax=Rhizophagus irregularis (strain DAOM 181602 / DAOM 197198 / MUCL 43194) TaxID=747089 RepID=A0A2P4PJW4_RHIID|nr:kinase-like domain-containing protein [Rhizophagus irregularis DAOM 181602=DAOM 197198]POG65675.1 kinase-like domain-containing protein [Rhizophagus irregularis DAOM 181602=DAOM 197198]|eukprot:XP_025172541.1 kinase-like domain-containing protein [Rhizophagus irregularis DAOM 181602=DAOM 197198]
MSENIKNEWIDWIEEAITKEYFKYYDYSQFSDVSVIGTGGFGKVYRANWKNSKYLALKSFSNFNNATAKEVVHEVKLQRDVDFHNNIISFYGITADENKKYLFVLEYADGGTLKQYLKKYLNNLTWDNKFNLAYQLASAVSCLHNEGIVHRDLHSGNVLVHQNNIKLADFGLSKRLGDATTQSTFFGVIPYIDPTRFSKRKNSTDPIIVYTLNKMSDVYSVGVLLWEISSYRPPFYTEGESYDVSLVVEISQGHRETVVPNTPEEYSKLYIECWDGEPCNRPTINQVVERLKTILMKSIILKTNSIAGNCFSLPEFEMNFLIEDNSSIDNISHNSLNSLHGQISQIINNFDAMNTQEIIDTLATDLELVANKLESFIFKITNEGKNTLGLRKQYIFDYLSKNELSKGAVPVTIAPEELFKWLLCHQNKPTYIFLLGYFYYLGIETNINHKKSFDLFFDASESMHVLSQYFVGECYQLGNGVEKKEKIAFEHFKRVAKKGHAMGQLKLGTIYDKGIPGIRKNSRKAANWYEKAADNGNNLAKYNLAFMYKDGTGVCKNYKKAFSLFKQSAENGDPDGMSMLGYCYNNGVGTPIDKMKAFESYQKAVKLGNISAQYNLALMYEAGEGIEKDIDEAIYWYKKASEQGDRDAENRLKLLEEIKKEDEMILFKGNFHNSKLFV